MEDIKNLVESAQALYKGIPEGRWKDCIGLGPQVFCDSPKGSFIIAEARGWGYYTGNSPSALGLSDTQGIEIQNNVTKHIAETHNILKDICDIYTIYRTEPLTVDEIKLMDGKPIWVLRFEDPDEFDQRKSGWCLVYIEQYEKYSAAYDYNSLPFRLERYNKDWIAFRQEASPEAIARFKSRKGISL